MPKKWKKDMTVFIRKIERRKEMEEIEENKTQKPMLIKEQRASEILGLSYAYLKVLRRKGLISWVSVGSSIRYRMSDLQRYVERNLIKADAENSL
jgi:hypothetical protein